MVVVLVEEEEEEEGFYGGEEGDGGMTDGNDNNWGKAGKEEEEEEGKIDYGVRKEEIIISKDPYKIDDDNNNDNDDGNGGGGNGDGDGGDGGHHENDHHDVNEVAFTFLEGAVDDVHHQDDDIGNVVDEDDVGFMNGHSNSGRYYCYSSDGGGSVLGNHTKNFNGVGGGSTGRLSVDGVVYRHGTSNSGGTSGLYSNSSGVDGSMGASEDRRQLPLVVLFLVLLGIIPSGIIFLVDVTVHRVFGFREHLAEGSSIHGFIIYVIGGVGLCLCSTFVCCIWSREAEGSGIPQMKAIMSGFYDRMKPALSLWTLLAKSIGLICVIGGGLPVGWEGPNVHISCIVAHHLLRIPGFNQMRKDRALRMQFMLCACSVGLASSFGTPIGGVLYALETTGSFYLVPTFWKSILATIAGALVYDMLYKTPLVEAFENTNFVAGDYMRRELLAFAFMGIIMGLMGAFFVKCVYWVYFVRLKRTPGTSRYIIVGIVAFLAAILQYPLRLFRLDPRSAINEFFSASNLQVFSTVDMLLLVLIKFPLIAVSIGLPVPAGVFIPCFLIGSGFGRLYGEFLKSIFGTKIVPGGYAVVGAAAFTAGVTRALSCAVVIFEVTGQLKHMVPTLVAVLVSVITANSINRSLYDALIIMKRLPYMPHMRRDRNPRRQRVKDIMKKDVAMLAHVCKTSVVRRIVDRYQNWDCFPVVDSVEERRVLGSVRRKTLVGLLARADDGDASVVGGGVRVNDRGRERREDVDMGQVVEGDITQGMIMGDGDDEDGMEMVELITSREEGHRHDDVSSEEGSDRQCIVHADLSPLVVTGNTTLGQLHFMFVMLMPTHALVTVGGRLAGIVTRRDIVQSGIEAS